jgi:hypothetical protein
MTEQPDLVVSLQVGLRAVHDAVIEAALHLHMKPKSIRYAELSGSMREQPAMLKTACWIDDKGATLTLALMTVANSCVAVTAVGLPSATSSRSVFGIDLVAMGGTMSLVAADIVAGATSTSVSNVMATLAQRTSVLPRRKVPDFAASIFSSEALIAGAPGGLGVLACAAVVDFVQGWSHLPTEATNNIELATRWCSAQRKNRREQQALGAVFGSSTIDYYMAQVMFPLSAKEAA